MGVVHIYNEENEETKKINEENIVCDILHSGFRRPSIMPQLNNYSAPRP